jgi:hypothetical protein
VGPWQTPPWWWRPWNGRMNTPHAGSRQCRCSPGRRASTKRRLGWRHGRVGTVSVVGEWVRCEKDVRKMWESRNSERKKTFTSWRSLELAISKLGVLVDIVACKSE